MIFNIHFQWSFLENQLREKQKQICHHHIISMIYPLTDHFSPQPITGQAITSKIGICNPLEGHWFLSSQLFCSKTECEIWQGFCSLGNLPGRKWHTTFFIIVMRTAVVWGLKQGKKNHMIILVWNRKKGQSFRMNATCTTPWFFSRSNVIPIPPSAAHFPQARNKNVFTCTCTVHGYRFWTNNLSFKQSFCFT